LISCQAGVFIIDAQNKFARDWLENRLLTTIEWTLVGVVEHPVETRFVTDTRCMKHDRDAFRGLLFALLICIR
jgi:chromosomal replication initiation ATPase DnaA